MIYNIGIPNSDLKTANPDPTLLKNWPECEQARPGLWKNLRRAVQLRSSHHWALAMSDGNSLDYTKQSAHFTVA